MIDLIVLLIVIVNLFMIGYLLGRLKNINKQ